LKEGYEMKKSKKDKKKLLANQTENGFLTKLQKGTEKLLNLQENPYDVFVYTIIKRFEYTHVDAMENNLVQFMENYYLDFPDLDKIVTHEDLANNFDDYLQIVQYYYLLTTTKGKKEFKKIVQWLPAEDERQTLLTWPDTHIISLFQPTITKDALYFWDLKNEINYEVLIDDEEIINTIQEKQPVFLTLLLPTENENVVGPLLECQNYNNLNEILTKDLPKEKWESQLFFWFRDNLSHELNELDPDLFDDNFFDSLSDEDFLSEYYSAERYVNESDTDFAERLLKQDTKLYNYAHSQKVKQMLVKIIQTFPRLFIARANIFPLLEALKVIFSDLKIEPENDQFLSDSLTHFWILLIFEYLPEEVKEAEKFEVKSEYWDEIDDLDLPF